MLIGRLHRRLDRLDSTVRLVLSSAAVSLGTNFFGKSLTLLTNIVLARTLSLDAFGIYVVALSTVTIFSIVATLGLQEYLMKHASTLYASGNLEGVRSVCRRTAKIGTVSFCLTATAAGVALALGFAVAPGLTGGTLPSDTVIMLSVALAPLISFGLFRQQTLRAMRRIIGFRFSETIVMNAVILFCVLVVPHLFPDDEWLGLGARVLGTIAGFLSGAWLLRMAFSQAASRFPADANDTRERSDGGNSEPLAITLRSSVSLMLGVLSQKFIGVLDVALVGALAGPEEAAIYFAATRLVMLMGFGLTGVNQILAPLASTSTGVESSISRGKLALTSMAISGTFAVGVLVVFALFGEHLMALFGSDFRSGGAVFFILIFAQLCQTLFAPLDTVLAMTGNEGRLAMVQITGIATGVLLHVVLTPQAGATGGAVATLSTVIVWRLAVFYLWRSDSRGRREGARSK